MAEYIVKTDKPIRLDEVLHLHGIHHFSVSRVTTPSRNHTCPYYQGVCGLDDAFLCYCQSRYEMCDAYKEANNGTDN